MQGFHTGGCHCGNIRFRVKTDLSKIITCNCSICAKKGTWFTFVPEKDFTLLSGEEYLKDYMFHKKVIHHLFCIECGVESFGRGAMPDGSEIVAINVRCLDGVDIHKLQPTPFEGKDL